MKSRGLVRSLRSWISQAPGMGWMAGYTATDPRRKVLNWANRPRNATSNEVLTSNLPNLVAYCRHLVRNNPTARAAEDGLVACVVGTGIALEPDTGDEMLDKLISAEFQRYCKDCGANGESIYQLQELAFREEVQSGANLWRFIPMNARLKKGRLPLAILPLEVEWLDNTMMSPGRMQANGEYYAGGIVLDKYGRPTAYMLKNPELWSMSDVERVSASQIAHTFEQRRAMQSQGEPWFAPVVEVLQQERDLVDVELKAATTCASIGLSIESEYHDRLQDGTSEDDEDGSPADPAHSLRLGGVARMYPGEKVNAFSHNRPSQAISPFRAMLRGDIAGALRISQRFLDRDSSRANYSSQRADDQDTQRLLGPVRERFGKQTIGRVYEEILPYIMVKLGRPMPRMDYRLLPDEQPYVNPKDDISAALMAISGGLSTYEREISKRGGDWKKVWEQAGKEKKEEEKLGLNFDQSGNGDTVPPPQDQPVPAAEDITN